MIAQRQRLLMIHAISQGMLETAERIGAEVGAPPEEVIGAWLADWLHHDMRDSIIRRKTGWMKERVGLPLPEGVPSEK